MLTAEFSLNIPPHELEKYYSGHSRSVIARASNGLRIQFPANLLLPYVDHHGISGRYILSYQEGGKAVSLERA